MTIKAIAAKCVILIGRWQLGFKAKYASYPK